MVKLFSQRHNFQHPWETVTQAHFKKYPNPFARHVLTSDVLQRTVESNGTMKTTRIFLKSGLLPAWGRQFLRSPEAFIIEDSEVSVKDRRMTVTTRNLSHKKLMFVEQTCIYEPLEGADGKEWTTVETTARIRSDLNWFGDKIESFGLMRFRDNLQKSWKGLSYVLDSSAAKATN